MALVQEKIKVLLVHWFIFLFLKKNFRVFLFGTLLSSLKTNFHYDTQGSFN